MLDDIFEARSRADFFLGIIDLAALIAAVVIILLTASAVMWASFIGESL